MKQPAFMLVHYAPTDRDGYRSWRPQDVETLKNLRADGKTFREIADALGRSYWSVKGKARDMKYETKRKEPDAVR